MPKPSPLPPDLQKRPFAITEALAAGVSRRRVRGSDLAAPFHAVRAPGDDVADLRRLCAAFRERAGTDVFFSHLTAARLLGLPLPPWIASPSPLHVTVIAPRRAVKAAGVIGHKADPGTMETGWIDGLPVVSPVDAWRQLAGILPFRDLVVAGDGLVRRRDPLATIEQLRAAPHRHAGRRGNKRLRAAVTQVRPGTDSAQETILRLAILRRGLPEPEVNGPITDEHGAFVALGDLVFREFRVLVEYDGGVHREDERQYHRDIDRLDDIMALDWRVVRVNRSHMANDAAVAVTKIRRALRRAGWPG